MLQARWVLLTVVASGCAVYSSDNGASSTQAIGTVGFNELNLAAASMVLYEAQARVANACHPDVGSPAQRAACRTKIAPTVTYRAEGLSCPVNGELEEIKLGTLDDMLEDTADYRSGITLRYVKEKVGANTLWLMPVFPNNDRWHVPDACDNLGSPYAVRDYMHASGTLSRRCIEAGKDEYAATPCWANTEVDTLIAQAHARGVKVMLDVALNHFGHNYLMYDYGTYLPVRDRATRGDALDDLWKFSLTEDPALVRPDVLDSIGKLRALVAQNASAATTLGELSAKCPTLDGDDLVRGFNMWREAFDHERATFDCKSLYLESGAPGFYLGNNRFDPSSNVGDNFSQYWFDVKFLFHREENLAHQWEFVRTREYLFRILNYWTSRGVDGFRLDHTTDPDSGSGANEWKYITTKVAHYAARRGQARPVFLAEEFHEQLEMNKVSDVMTEGYMGDMSGRGGVTKDTHHVEAVLDNMGRFDGHAFTMTGLETHDEKRLVDGTGFNIWTGAGFWGIGASTRSVPMMLMGQEFGERRQMDFRRSSIVSSRFVGSEGYEARGDVLSAYYQKMNTERLRPENRALLSPHSMYLRSRWTGAEDARIFAQARWSDDGSVFFVFHNLWEQSVAQSYFIDPQLAAATGMRNDRKYRLYDVLSDRIVGQCKGGADLKWDFYVAMDAHTRAQWLRLETCP